MFTSIFTSFDIIITNTNYQEKLAVVFIFIPLLWSSIYWGQLAAKSGPLYSSMFLVNNIVSFAHLRGLKLMAIAAFIFILSINFWGILPYVFPVSRHMSLTMSWSFPFWTSLLMLGLVSSYIATMSYFCPRGTSWLILPLLILVEVIRRLIRPITLAFRLAANITAGHVILALVASSYWLVPLFYTIFEIGVCIAQAYVFVMLCNLYSIDYLT